MIDLAELVKHLARNLVRELDCMACWRYKNGCSCERKKSAILRLTSWHPRATCIRSMAPNGGEFCFIPKSQNARQQKSGYSSLYTGNNVGLHIQCVCVCAWVCMCMCKYARVCVGVRECACACTSLYMLDISLPMHWLCVFHGRVMGCLRIGHPHASDKDAIYLRGHKLCMHDQKSVTIRLCRDALTVIRCSSFAPVDRMCSWTETYQWRTMSTTFIDPVTTRCE